MEKYVNLDSLIDNQISQLFKDKVLCPLCNNILIKPVMCNCQKVYCKKCIDIWEKTNKACPNNCKNPHYQKCLGKEEILSKLQFKCIKCNEDFLYKDAEEHHKSCCPNRNIKIVNEENKKNIKKKKKNNINKNRDKDQIIKSKF